MKKRVAKENHFRQVDQRRPLWGSDIELSPLSPESSSVCSRTRTKQTSTKFWSWEKSESPVSMGWVAWDEIRDEIIERNLDFILKAADCHWINLIMWRVWGWGYEGVYVWQKPALEF